MQDKNNEYPMGAMPPKQSTRKIILDALSAETSEEATIGKPENPVLPLVGSLNVPISKEEEIYER